MPLTEADTRVALIDPALHARGWTSRGLTTDGCYCLGGVRVACQDTNCTLLPRLAHTL